MHEVLSLKIKGFKVNPSIMQNTMSVQFRVNPCLAQQDIDSIPCPKLGKCGYNFKYF